MITVKEEKNITSISKDELEKLHKELTPADYVRYIESVNAEHLWTYLTEYMRYLNTHVHEVTADINKIESAIRVVQKGFRYYSEKNNALRYFLYGYFSNQQDELLQKLYIICNHERIEQILSKKHLREIISYLYVNDIVQQKDLVKYLKVSKTNINHIVMPLIECGLVEKIKAGAAFYKLTSSGYEYCRQKKNETPETHVQVSFEIDYIDDAYDKLQDFDKGGVETDIQPVSLRANYRKKLDGDEHYWEIRDCDRKYSSAKRKFLKV